MRYLLTSRLRLTHNPIQSRTILTHSIEPPAHVSESPNSVLLLEQSLPYCLHDTTSWHETFATTLQARGVPYRRSDIFASTPFSGSIDPLPCILTTLANDVSSASGGIPSRLLLVAHGPIPSLLAQYHLESLPLGGLILINPFIFAGEDNDYGSNDARLVLHHTKVRTLGGGDVSAGMRGEMEFLQSLSARQFGRKLKLEPGAVPVMVIWTEGAADSDRDNTRWEKDRVYRTADFHRDVQSGTEVEVAIIDNDDDEKDAELEIVLKFFEEQIF